MTPWRFIFALGLAHAVGDAISGYTVASLGAERSFFDLGLIVLAYDIVAFGLQPIAGFITDRIQDTWKATLVGMSAMGLGLLLSLINPLIGVGFIAFGSAFFHVGAGALASEATPERTIGAAVFTAPGVIGLALGTVAGLESLHIFPWLLTFTIVAILLLMYARNNARSLTERRLPTPVQKVSHAVFFAISLLLVGVVIRSGVWVAFSSSSLGVNAILIFGIVAGLGKLFGGIAADMFGAKIVIPITVLAALVCFINPSFLLIVLGVFFLQSSTPIILTEVIKRLPRFPATGAGLVLGFAIVIGGVMTKVFSVEIIRRTEVMVLLTIVAAIVFSLGLATRFEANKHRSIS